MRPFTSSHRRACLTAGITALGVCGAACVQAWDAMHLDDAYGDAFVNYQPYLARPPTSDAHKAVPQASALPAAPTKVQPKGEQTVDVAWLRRNYARLETQAINDPTGKSLEAFLYTKRISVDKAQRYSEAYMKATIEDPLLNENNRIPYASMGAQYVRNADYRAQQEAARELAAIGGSVLFVDSSCRFCAMQIPVLQALKNNYHLEFLVVSLDGKAPAGYQGPYALDNGLFGKLGLKLTPSLVYVPRPRGYHGEVDPNQYLILAQGFYTQDEMVKQLAFAAHSRKLLSDRTMADLNVWDRGVASTADLNALMLDPERPETFKQKLQPILMKQYQ